MFHIESLLSDADFAKLTFREKMSMAKDLAISYGMTIFLVLLAGIIIIGLLSIIMTLFVDFSLLNASGPDIAGAALVRFIIGAAAFIVVIGCVSLLYIIGVSTLALYYVDGNEPDSIFAVVMAPWAHLGSVILNVLLWLGAGVLVGFLTGLISMVPIVGFAFALVGFMFFLMLLSCAGFYTADRVVIYQDDDLSNWRAFFGPLAMVKNSINSWLTVFGVLFILSLPVHLLMGLGLFLAAGGRGGIVLCSFVSLIYFIIVSIFIIFLLALTYRQTRGQAATTGDTRS